MYGKIDFTADDIATLLSVLASAERAVSDNISTAAQGDELEFYRNALTTVGEWTATVRSMRPGEKGLSEDQLLYLRGTVADGLPELCARWGKAKAARDPSYAVLDSEVDNRNSLLEKLRSPFLEDRSTDADVDGDD